MEADPATGNNKDQGKCLGTKLGALQLVSVPVFFTACVSAGWDDRYFAREWWGVFRAVVIENWGVVVPLALTKNGVQDMAWRRSPRPRREHVCSNQNGSVSIVS